VSNRWLVLLMVGVALLLAVAPFSHDPLQQTTFLERVASRIERAAVIAPHTETAIRQMVQSMRRSTSPADEQLANRQQVAIQRIEAILWDRGGLAAGQEAAAAEGAFPSRESVEASSGESLKPLRPLYPFVPHELHDSRHSSLERAASAAGNRIPQSAWPR
jgi:hypothetical protein